MTETCRLDGRRDLLRQSRLNGIDEVEVADDRRTLIVRFFHDAPKALSPRHLRLSGGVAVRGIEIVDVRLFESDDPDEPTMAEVLLNRSGDASTYVLRVWDLENFDPRYHSATFTFYPDFHDDVDCVGTGSTFSNIVTTPPIDYLAKDYTGFRQLMLDRLAVTMPDWQERHIPDVQLMLVEMLAYTTDRLSYFQDAVATEAYLATARRRLSVARHVRLVDYRMHEGCTARVLVQLDPGVDGPLPITGLSFAAGLRTQASEFYPTAGPDAHIVLRKANTRLRFHCWGDSQCILPKGSRSATLVDDAPEEPPGLRAGDFLILELINPSLDGAPDPDVARRHPIRLTSVRRGVDPLLNVALLDVVWTADDATPVDFPLDPSASDAGLVLVARGNLVLAQQGKVVVDGDPQLGSPILPDIGFGSRRTVTLSAQGLGFAAPIGRRESARKILSGQDPRSALPTIDRIRSWPAGATTFSETGATVWSIKPDLIGSGPTDTDVMVEIDDGGVAILRFGDGISGKDPAGLCFEIAYRTSSGPTGNLGADSISTARHTTSPEVANWPTRNPLPASGGVAPEDVAKVRLLAPTAFRTRLARAITAQDYADLAVQLEPDVQRAVCTLVHSGVRTIARIAIDPIGSEGPAEILADQVEKALLPYRAIGHDVEVSQCQYTPLLLILEIRVRRGYRAGHVRAALLQALTSGLRADGSQGPFHPDQLTFGTAIYGSRLLAAAQAVAGVESVRIIDLARLFDRERSQYSGGVLTMQWDEVPRLDNDPLRPDHGRLELRLNGGDA